MLGKSTAKLLDRKDHLLSMFRGIKTRHIAPIIGSHIMRDMDEAMVEHEKFVQEGYEGTMVKDINSVYECKRSFAVQKIKDMETLDLVVVGVEEGEEGT
ncbi:ATP-dependent DNA ligase, partial [Mycobacterium tuberculosis]|uniref:ATP-dependent DNA ligase n=1 Tax=Mycobacterium tuberculosis TaxID=1773 RepID=UPI0034DCD358